ncbi:sulfoxide reductase heme-binding subunit YedZ [Herbaspirillum lusitanum]|uniref:Protein-methionine-sulfoxide reductase heme-binding subunit MsrQ n=1 Tax=Herbaspirillum lusitanum TaxID=213312 RepID=A0ABW9A7R5_9BURK
MFARLRNLSQRQVRTVWLLVLLLCLLPLARLIALGVTGADGGLGANPIEFITRSTGDWALYLLSITLAVTPLRKLSGLNWLVRLRRTLGLMAFLYLSLHFLTFFWFDHFFDLQEMWKDILRRPFITVGVIALVLMLPLALTSTNRMIRLLGGKRWQLLHKLMYLIAPLAVLHFWWAKAGKNLIAQPVLFASIVGVLLLARVGWWLQKRRAEQGRATAAVTRKAA